MSNKISVVICAYNYARFLPRCLQSVLSQSRPADEIIVVDDGSTDQTQDVVAGFRSVRYVRQENAGKAAAFNRGFQTATGTILCHLDADDYWLPNKLECVTTILATTTAGGMTHGAHYVDAAGNRLYQTWPETDLPKTPVRLSFQEVLCSCFLYPPRNLVRSSFGVANTICVWREAVADLFPLPEDLGLAVDGALVFAAARNGLIYLPEDLSAYCHHDANYYVRDLSTRKFQSRLYRWLFQAVDSLQPRDKGLLQALVLETEAHSSMLTGKRPVAAAGQASELIGKFVQLGISPHWKHWGLPLACLLRWGQLRNVLQQLKNNAPPA
ncbi:MAG TPA: glycosyltransferase family 2 protein [Candidatus Dormibacteraeota bacterium]|nr:glycosyltransferase family 2 protein [Candidatus Dormibacteraeota bacterium]